MLRIDSTLKAVICLCLFTFASGAEERPNVIVIFTDDHGYSDLACQDLQKDLKTPHIDALAAGGVRMTSGYVTAPQCVPSRAGLLAGRQQNRFGVESNGMPLAGFGKQRTIGERLKAVGYATGMAGKWHLGPAQEISQHGFDDVYFKNSNRPGWSNFDLDGNTREGGRENSKLYHLDANSEAACAFIKRHHKQPFFFYCAYRAPHVPLDAPPKYLKRFPGKMAERRRQALAMISAMDDGVGRIMSTLKQYGLEEKTLLFFIGDNGAPLKIHKEDAPGGGPGWDGSLNDPLNGEKGMLSEGGIRVPYVVHWKSKFPGGQVFDHPVSSLDVSATALSLAGSKDTKDLDGIDLVPYLTGKTKVAPQRTLYWRWIAQSAVREGKWKYLRGGQREYLFDLDADKEEKRNLLKKYPEVAASLRKKLETWAQDLKPAGLATKPMSTVWESYFDYYLDGKPAPRLVRSSKRKQGRDDVVQGWVARSAKATQREQGLTVVSNSNRRPFIACAKIKIPGPAVVEVDLKASKKGRVGVSWREQGQSDFPKDQTAFAKNAPSVDGFEKIQIKIPARQRIIHVRLLLPEGTSVIRNITVKGGGDQQHGWNFQRK